jgi:molybdenum cofactor cytidylyltransferase
MDKRPTAGIILAAGMSTRFGRLKQTLEIEGSTILFRVIDAVIKSDIDKVVLVLGYQEDAIKAVLGDILLNPKLKIVINPRYQEGMSTSLQCGLTEIRDEFPSIMVLMGDQPLLSHKVINILLNSFRSSDKNICVPVYKGTRGLPVCFTRMFFNDILEVTGDMGARDIIRNNPMDVLTVEIEDSNFFIDIDEEADLKRVKTLFEKNNEKMNKDQV